MPELNGQNEQERLEILKSRLEMRHTIVDKLLIALVVTILGAFITFLLNSWQAERNAELNIRIDSLKDAHDARMKEADRAQALFLDTAGKRFDIEKQAQEHIHQGRIEGIRSELASGRYKEEIGITLGRKQDSLRIAAVTDIMRAVSEILRVVAPYALALNNDSASVITNLVDSIRPYFIQLDIEISKNGWALPDSLYDEVMDLKSHQPQLDSRAFGQLHMWNQSLAVVGLGRNLMQKLHIEARPRLVIAGN